MAFYLRTLSLNKTILDCRERPLPVNIVKRSSDLTGGPASTRSVTSEGGGAASDLLPVFQVNMCTRYI